MSGSVHVQKKRRKKQVRGTVEKKEGEGEMKGRGSMCTRDGKRMMVGWSVCRSGWVNEISLIAGLKVACCRFYGAMTLMGCCVPFRYCCGLKALAATGLDCHATRRGTGKTGHTCVLVCVWDRGKE